MEPAPADSVPLEEPQVNNLSTMVHMECQNATEEACEYARRNDLTLNYEAICPRLCLGEATELLPRQLAAGLTSEANLPTVASQYAVNVHEDFPVSYGTLKTLAETLKTSTKAELGNCIEEISGNAMRNLKLELPLLSSDHEADCRAFRRGIEAISAPRVKNHRLPLDPADPENDEGLEFPSRLLQIARKITDPSEPETINVSRDLLECLLRQLKVDPWTPEDQVKLIEDEAFYISNRARDPLTPPLSPMFPPKFVYIPEGDVCQIPSDCSSNLSEELKTAEDALFQLDKIENPSPNASVNTALSCDLLDLLPSSPSDHSTVKNHKLDELKVEVPLVSDLQDNNSSRLPIDLGLAAESIERSSPSDLELPDDVFDPELKAGLEKLAIEMMRKVEQEKVQVVDAVSRVTVPVMDFSAPRPPWDEAQQSASSMFLGLWKNEPGIFALPRWPKDRLVEGRMQWYPVHSRNAISTRETVSCGDELLSSFLDFPDGDEVLASMQPSRRCNKLLILRDSDVDDDDDEIEPMFRERKTGAVSDLGDAVKQRKTTEEQRRGIQGYHASADGNNMTYFEPLSTGLSRTPSALLMGDGLGATSSMLSNYMELRAPHKTLQRSRFFKMPAKSTEGQSRNQTLEARKEIQDVPMSLPIAPFPEFDSSATPAKVVVAVGLARGIISRLEALLPKLSFVERDYSAYNNSVWHPGSVRRSEHISPLAYDADIILSPASGIVITTMVMVRQRPIPGSQGTTVFRHRIDRISERYERLIVLVSEGTNDGSETMGEMSPSDVLAFADLQGFLSGLGSTITAYYVGGGEATVARWAASFICRVEEGRELGNLLIDSETYWELFLRRAGVNVYAAQVIAGLLKVTDAALEEVGQSGLAAFTRMTPHERVERFETVFGGRRVLQRVNRAMDQAW